MKRLVLFSLLFAGVLYAEVPAVECRFAALSDNSEVELDEVVTFIVAPGARVDGDFDPYDFKLAVFADVFQIRVRLNGDTINNLLVPIPNILALPIGASVFGVNTIDHPTTEKFVSLRYECVRITW